MKLNADSLTLHGREFQFASKIDACRNSFGAVELHQPHLRYGDLTARLVALGQGPFSKLTLDPLPNEPGVYAVTADDEKVLYVGLARDSLRERWSGRGYSNISPRNCYVGGQATNVRVSFYITEELLASRPLNLWICVTDDFIVLEHALIDELQPTWNRLGIRTPR